MKRLAVLAGIALALPLTAAAKTAPPLLGIVGNKIMTQQLVRFDAATLRPAGATVPLAAHRYGWSLSPDGARVALGSSGVACARTGTTLRLVDVNRMHSLGDLQIAASGPVQASAWLSPRRVVAVVGPGRCGSAKHTRVVAVDVDTGHVVTRTWVRGNLINTARAPGKLVLFFAPPGKIGSVRLVVVGADGVVHQKLLEGVAAGQRVVNGHAVVVATPGLAVDPVGGRAFVLTNWDGVTEVDLRTLRVGYHPLTERSLAKSMNGSEREALWLGNGLLALTGSDLVKLSTIPAGLKIVDTRTWKSRTVDSKVSRVELAGGVLLADGSSFDRDGGRTTSTFTGLIAYSRTGRELYRVFEGAPIGRTAVIAGRGYATVGGMTYKNRTTEFDLATGKIGRSLDQPLWELLLPTG
jgi:hypothetical protein